MPFGDDQAYKGFALALLVERSAAALAGERGHAAVALLAAPVAAPMGAIRAQPATTACPETTLPLVTAPAPARAALELPDDLWRWLQAV